MNVNATDLFCGAGGTSSGLIEACDELGHELELTAINHWDVAIRTHSANYPWANHLCESLEKIDPRVVIPSGRLNIMVASPECFVAGTLILTPHGLVPIEQVREGDLVMTHQNRWRRVTSTMRSRRAVSMLRGHGHFGLACTATHPFWSRTRRRHWPKYKRSGEWRWSEPKWMPSRDLPGTFWATPTAFPWVGVPLCNHPQTTAFWWMVGRWIGDGSLDLRPGRGGAVTISCGKHEAKGLAEHLKIWKWKQREIRTAVNFDLRDRQFAEWLARYFGQYAHGKRLPAWALSMDEPYRRHLLSGYLSADGSFDGRKHEAVTVSRELAIGMRLLAESLGYRVALHREEQHCSEIEGRTLSVRPVYRLVFIENRKRSYGEEIGGFAWSSVKSSQPIAGEDVPVFNLSVEDDESYVADGIIVHNCTHHSVARGGRPTNDQSRASAWLIMRWLELLYVENLLIENVSEFRDWGPVGVNGKPLKNKKGAFYQSFLQALRSAGYTVEDRILNAANYGDPTTRQRLFIMARRGRRKITWPEPSHSANGGNNLFGKTEKWKAAREIIDWELKGQNIFERKKPLADKTMRRIIAGLRKFGGPQIEPYLVMMYGTGGARSLDRPLPTVTADGQHIALCEPFLLGQQSGGAPRSVDDPMPTVATKGAIALCTPFVLGQQSNSAPRSVEQPIPTIATGGKIALIIPQFSEHDARSIDRPLNTVTTTSRGIGLVEAAVINKYYGTGVAQPVTEPLDTVTTKDRFGLVTCEKGHNAKLEIRFRMLQPHELAAAHSFTKAYQFTGGKTEQVKQIGNSVPVQTAKALCRELLA